MVSPLRWGNHKGIVTAWYEKKQSKSGTVMESCFQNHERFQAIGEESSHLKSQVDFSLGDNATWNFNGYL